MTGASVRPRDVDHFPSSILDVGSKLVRIHRLSPWHFSRDGSGRFDHPEVGTCYTGESDLGALLENTRGATLLSAQFIQVRSLSRVAIAEKLTLADTLHPSSYEHGYTLSISTGHCYEPSQEWARALKGAGFDGIRYLLRHDVTAKAVGVALFGVTRVRSALERGGTTTEPLTQDVIALGRPFGLRFAGPVPAVDARTQDSAREA